LGDNKVKNKKILVKCDNCKDDIKIDCGTNKKYICQKCHGFGYVFESIVDNLLYDITKTSQELGLYNSNDDYDDELNNLKISEKELSLQKEINEHLIEENSSLQADKNNLKNKIAELKKENKKIEKKIVELNNKIEKISKPVLFNADYYKTKTGILNPLLSENIGKYIEKGKEYCEKHNILAKNIQNTNILSKKDEKYELSAINHNNIDYSGNKIEEKCENCYWDGECSEIYCIDHSSFIVKEELL
jgi:hypothetical protein